MFERNEQKFQSSNKCWVCDKVRDHCHVTEKYRGSAHQSFNVNLRLTKKGPVIFHNLRAFGSHLIMHETDKFGGKVNVIRNGLE